MPTLQTNTTLSEIAERLSAVSYTHLLGWWQSYGSWQDGVWPMVAMGLIRFSVVLTNWDAWAL